MGIATAVASAPAPRRGVIEGGARVLRELLRTPRVRRSIEIVLAGLDPENAPSLVRAVTEDQALALDLVASAPALANASFAAARELLSVAAGEPAGLLRALTARLLGELDAEELGRAAGLGLVLVRRLRGDDSVALALARLGRGVERGVAEALERHEGDGGALPERAVEAALRRAGAIAARLGPESLEAGSPTARAVRALALGIPGLAERHPAFVEGVVRPLAGALRAALAPRVAEVADER
jgi:hypothetical protein